MSVRVGIVGASGYTGVELIRLVLGHPRLTLTRLGANKAAGERLTTAWPGLSGLAACDGLVIDAFDPADAAPWAAACDVVFLALPHGLAAHAAPRLLDAGVRVFDLGADFRLRDSAVYRATYGLVHPSPELLERAVYALVERERARLLGASLVACPGCYPTATALALGPLVDAGLCDGWVVADCLSGISGAGRAPGPRNLFAEVAESASAYGLAGTHRHVPEIEQALGLSGRLTFTPHLVPMIRGMLATVHTRPREALTTAQAQALWAQAYAAEPMVVVRDTSPSTADVRGTNRAHVNVVVDAARGVLTATCAIDNLLKGASGQAVQALNVVLGFDETLGLPVIPLLP